MTNGVLLEAELTRRTARTEWEAGADERTRQWVLDTLQQMAQRLAAAGSSPDPLHLDDMSPAEKLACHMLPKPLRPAGLPSKAAIWAEYEALRAESLWTFSLDDGEGAPWRQRGLVGGACKTRPSARATRRLHHADR